MLVVVLVCVAATSVVFTGLVRSLAAQHRAAQTDQWRVQAGWLSESGLERAASRLGRDPKYAGETWKIPADAPGGRRAAVRIEIQTLAGQPGRRTVRVQAVYPDDSPTPVRETRQAIIPVRTTRS